MALLKLDSIGKIYVSEGNVAVGIRGVNLSFDRGEFVAITGESGSGKSTMLNVLSGMDTYEEGELYIEGEPTSHYLQPDWEQYRQKYISFIFQEYNIIDSFTVLQNVELALMTIKNPGERRQRALELIKRVGLEDHIRHKGSQLSGGQKQRTVIARALAKDSPIILADEPTGNLDSATGKEIIELLREVSKDKLMIIVTHDFELVENVATRHIRIFDGAVESDRVLRESGSENPSEPVAESSATPAEASASETAVETASDSATASKKESTPDGSVSTLGNGIRLGWTLFTSRPKLSLFLCFLLLLGMTFLFFVTALCSGATDVFRDFYLLRRQEGRLVLVRQDAQALTDEELEGLKQRFSAKDSLHYDYLLDAFSQDQGQLPVIPSGFYDERFDDRKQFVYDADFGEPDYGQYPQAENEVFLRLPLYYRNTEFESGMDITEIEIGTYIYKIVGTKFIADNNQPPVFDFTRDGFLIATATAGAFYDVNDCLVDGEPYENERFLVLVSADMDPEKMYSTDESFMESVRNCGTLELSVMATGRFMSVAYSNGMGYNPEPKAYSAVKSFTKADFLENSDIKLPNQYKIYERSNAVVIIIGAHIAEQLFNDALKGVYGQASLFFDSDKTAKNVADTLRPEGYTAITTDETYLADMYTLEELFGTFILLGFAWLATVLLIVFVINLCSNRSVESFRSDLAIMRSMGIPVKVIKTGMYVRMFLALVPALIAVGPLAYLVYHNEVLNYIFTYLRPVHYIILVIGLIFLTWRTTRKQVRNLFSASVKKSLRGGDEA